MSLGEEGREDLLRVRIRALAAGGEGLGNLPDGRVLFVPRTAPGDLVQVKLRQEKKRWARGEVQELLEEGEGRREAPCIRYAECHGCSLQHLDYGRQLHWKGRILGDTLRRIGGLTREEPTVAPSPQELRYRNKVTLTLRRLPGARLAAGFHQLLARSRILDVGGECLLMDPELASMWGSLRESWGPGASYLPEGRELRLTLRWSGEWGVLLIRGGRGQGKPQELLGAVEGLASIWREEERGRLDFLAGEETLSSFWMGEEVEVSGGAFLQVNREAGEEMYRYVLDHMGDVEGLDFVEGYSGVGILGRALARRGARVLGIEMDPLGVKASRYGAPSGFQAIQGRVEEVLEDHLPADGLIMNPPRTGLDPRITETLAGRPQPRLVYISCDPATLARDLQRLGSSWEVEEVGSFDLFPQTAHVETVVLLKGQSD